MIFIRPLTLIFVFVSFNAQAGFDWLALFEKSTDMSSVFDEYQAAEPSWSDDSDYKYSLEPFTPTNKNNLSNKLCGSKFYPAHPMANTKLYHFAKYKRYQTHKIPADSYICRTTSRGARKYCLASGSLKFVVISDTFFDSCGRYFRGFWPVAYNTDHENNGTLLAKGRTITPRPNSPFRNDFIPSNTYEVQKSDFIYFAPLLKGDVSKINKAVQSSRKFYQLIKKNMIFRKEEL